MTKENKKEFKYSAPKLEILVILVFFLCFIIWTVSKCSEERSAIQQEQMLLEENEAKAAAAANLEKEAEIEKTETKPKVAETPKKPKKQNTPAEAKSVLYITIDGLNMRTDPHLDSTVVIKLPLFEEVYFLNEVTDFKQEISLGKKIVNEPWVKVRTKKGREGWVYGAGVNYYKVKTEGVQ